jgi:hypothetical protein
MLILDITLCGGWASSDYPNSGCGGGTCAQQVTNGNNFVGDLLIANLDARHCVQQLESAFARPSFLEVSSILALVV